MESPGINKKSSQWILLIVVSISIAFIATYIIRDRSAKFREVMDKYIPINPFTMANIVIKADQEKFVKDLHPAVQDRFRGFIKACEDAGWTIICTSGYRDFQKQYTLWKQNSNNARPGKSHHNYGLALDINATRAGTWLRKSSSEKSWLNSGIPAIAKKFGLSWQYKFGSYVDPVHFYYKVDTAKLLQRGIAQFGSESKIIGNKVSLT